MIEVDLFWAFSFGAVFAACDARSLQREPVFYKATSFVYTLLFLSVIFSSAGIYLLMDQPGWETMFVYTSLQDIPAFLPALFVVFSVAIGSLGYYITYRKIRSYKDAPYMPMSIYKYWVHSISGSSAIIGMGYNRFTFSGTGAEWDAGVVYPLSAFLGSRLMWTLVGLACFMVPAAYIPCYLWLKKSITQPGDKLRMVLSTAYYAMEGVLVISSLFGAYIVRYHQKNEELSYFQNLWAMFDQGHVATRESKWSLLLVFWLVEVVTLVGVSLPLFFVSPVKETAAPAAQNKKKSYKSLQ